MNIQEQIERHKKGELNFRNIGSPKDSICIGDNDYITYLNYCWEFLMVVGSKISELEFLVEDDAITIGKLSDDALSAHAIIERCHKVLNVTPNKNYVPVVYTTTMVHEEQQR
jgi:hypothetical protein